MRQASGNFPFHWDTGTCVILCPFGKQRTTWLSPPTHACQLVVFLSVFQHQAGRTCPTATPPNPSPGLVPPNSPPFRRGEGRSLRRERSHELDAAVQKACTVRNRLCPVPSLRYRGCTQRSCLKLGNSALLAMRGALLLNHQIGWLNIKLWFVLSKRCWRWMESCLGCGLMNQNPTI